MLVLVISLLSLQYVLSLPPTWSASLNDCRYWDNCLISEPPPGQAASFNDNWTFGISQEDPITGNVDGDEKGEKEDWIKKNMSTSNTNIPLQATTLTETARVALNSQTPPITKTGKHPRRKRKGGRRRFMRRTIQEEEERSFMY